MHFEVLVEDASGKIALDILLPKLLPPNGDHTFRTIRYKGIGYIRPGLTPAVDPAKRQLLDNLPRLLRGYGKATIGLETTVLVVLDLDRRQDCIAFKNEMTAILMSCQPRPRAYFRIAIEEMEAWFLGDQVAVLSAYPKAKRNVLATYLQDSICGTWEKLADAVHSGGSVTLVKQGWPAPGVAKCNWAANIVPGMDIDRNQSPSFRCFTDLIRRLVTA